MLGATGTRTGKPAMAIFLVVKVSTIIRYGNRRNAQTTLGGVNNAAREGTSTIVDNQQRGGMWGLGVGISGHGLSMRASREHLTV